MPILFNTVTWYSKLGAVILFILVVPTLTFFIGREYQKTVDVLENAPVTDSSETPSTPVVTPPTSFDPKNATYTIEGEEVTLKNGVAGSDRTETRIFGEPVWGDVSGDGKSDAVFYLSQTTGGTGMFYYVVAMFGENMSSEVFLGDRIAPQNIMIEGGYAVVNYAVRKDSEPMTARPSVGASKRFYIENGEMIELAPRINNVFEASQATDSNVGNVVGYFAEGAFFWYVPDWIEQNWRIDNATENEGFIITPKTAVPNRNFSDIILAVNPSTESYNAVTLYEKEKNSGAGRLIINEVLLNKHGDGITQINMETNTRIYHVQREVNGRIYDRYFIDGSGSRTLYAVFHATSESFSNYATQIRDMMQRIGIGGQPQG